MQHGDIDQVLTLYQRLKTQSPRILNTIGQLYADRKGDYNSAAKYYKKAMKIQEEVYRSNEFDKNDILLFRTATILPKP